MTDDNFKNAEAELLDENMKARILAEQEKYGHRMPKKYIGFTVKHSCFWLVLNLLNILFSGANAAGSVLILGREHE